MKRLLLVTHRVPYPPDKGERVRAFHQIQALAEHFSLTLATLTRNRQDEKSVQTLQRWCQKVIVAPTTGAASLVRGGLSLLSGVSVTEGYFHSGALKRLIEDESRSEPFDIAMGCSSSMLPYVLAASAKARVMDLVDVDSAKWVAYAKAACWPRSWLYRREAAEVAKLERRAVHQCNAVVLVSRAEAEALACGSEKVDAVTNGVDAEYFRPGAVEPSADGPKGLVFTGQMDYRPNVEGVCWFVREVWPELKRRVGEVTLTIVGRDPTAAVRQLAEIAGIAVTGAVSDVRPHLAAASVAICPLRMARGIQNKVLEAMAMGKAVVASPPALEGLEVEAGTHVLSADSPAEWVERVAVLLGDSQTRDSLGSAARRHVLDNYTWLAAMAPLVSLCQSLCGADAEAEKTAPESVDRGMSLRLRDQTVS